MYSERSLTCVQCGSEFIFSSEDQEFHAARGYQDPKRCPTCRAERRSDRGGGYSDRPQREMYSATCARCGREARVPFIPRNDRPVYCSDCYQPAPRRW